MLRQRVSGGMQRAAAGRGERQRRAHLLPFCSKEARVASEEEIVTPRA